MTQHTPDFAALKERARNMSKDALLYSIRDCSNAADMADRLELAGMRVLKTGGFYRDEISVYARELRTRVDGWQCHQDNE